MKFNGYCVAALMAEVLTLYKIPMKGANEIQFCNIIRDGLFLSLMIHDGSFAILH